jgi:hypothetical protein
MTQTIVNLGTGGAALNGQNGSTTSADSNDALFLDWTGENYAYTPIQGASSNRLTVPDAAPLKITGDLDVRVRVALDDWTPASGGNLASKFGGSGNRSWSFTMQDSGIPRILFTTDGSTLLTANATVAPTVTDGDALWMRFTLDVDNGASGRDIKFFTSDDGSTWTPLGATVTQAGTVSIYDSTAQVALMGRDDTGAASAGKIYRAQILDGIDGTTVLDVVTSVISSGSATSFTALTGQTVTINRSASGRKAVAVVSPCWLFGTDDEMRVPNNDLLNFDVSDSFTVVAVHRPWNTQGTNDTLIAKKADTTNTTQGYSLSGGSTTALQGQAQIGDGTAGITAVSGSRTSGQLTISAAVRNVTTDNVTVYLNGTAGTAVTDTTTGSLSNAEVLRIARLSGAGTEYADMELLAVAVFRRALTETEISRITAYYQARLS